VAVPSSYLSPFKAAHHLDDIAALRDGRPIAPRNIQVDLEAFCPHSCEFCSYRNVGWQQYEKAPMQFEEPAARTEQTGMARDIALALPRQMYMAGIPSIEITGGGESLVYPYIGEFLDECGEYGIEIGLVTNGVALRDSVLAHVRRDKLKWVRFSVDAITDDVYSEVHRTPRVAFGTLMRNIKRLIDWRDPAVTLVGVSFVITQHNYLQIAKAAAFFKELGVDSVRYTYTFDPGGEGRLSKAQHIFASDLLRMAKFRETPTFRVFTVDRLEAYSRPNDDFSMCGYQHFVWAIGYNGIVYPCCIMKYHTGYEIGDLSKQTLKDIVLSEHRRNFAAHLNVMDCKSCYLRDKNKFIEYLLDKNPAHVNFV